MAAIGSHDVRVVPWQIKLVERLHHRAHYGYVAIVIGGLSILFSSVGATFGVGFFNEYFMAELELPRSIVSACWTIALLGSGLILPVVGRAVDRFGLRMVMYILIVPYTLSLVWMANVYHPVSMAFCFFSLRLCMATAQLAGCNTVNQWWVKYRGMALGITNSIGGLSLMFPSLQLALTTAFGWRQAIYVEAFLILGVQLFIAILTLNHPEHYHRAPDGGKRKTHVQMIASSAVEFTALPSSDTLEEIELRDSNLQHIEVKGDNDQIPLKLKIEEEEEEATTKKTEKIEYHWRWQDALRTPAFWATALCSCFTAILWSGFNFHFDSAIKDLDLPPETINFVFIPTSVSSLVWMILVGWLFDRVRVQTRILALAPLLGAVCCAILLFMSNQGLAVVFGIAFGAMDSVQTLGNMACYSNMFGRANLGTIYAVANALTTISIGVGPTLFGVIRDTTGSYSAIVIATGLACAIMSLCLVLLPPPRLPDSSRLLELNE